MAKRLLSTAAVDTSVIIAVICDWHESHAKSIRLLETYLDAKAALILPAHALLETYSVLTRLPVPHRLRPADAMQLIAANVANFSEVAGLRGTAVLPWLKEWSGAQIAGGRIYDLAILEISRAAGARDFITLNPRDVAGFEGNLTIVVPE